MNLQTRFARKILLVLIVCAVVAAALGRYFFYVSTAEPPELTGILAGHTINIGGIERQLVVYRPHRPIEIATESGRPEVALVTVDGGGHTIAGPDLMFPLFPGRVKREFSAIEEIWRSFSREVAVPDF